MIAAANRPDICYFMAEKASQFSEDQVLFPAPDLVVAVLSESTKSNDRGIKFKDYEAHGIVEYWLVDPRKGNYRAVLVAGWAI